MGNDTSSPRKDKESKTGSGRPSAVEILIFGSHGVGKRSLWRKVLFPDAEFDPMFNDTTALELEVNVSRVSDSLMVSSTFASSEFATSTHSTAKFKQAAAFVLVYDVCDRESFESMISTGTEHGLLTTIEDSQKKTPSRSRKVLLVANKVDEYTDEDVWGDSPDNPNAEAVEALQKWKKRQGCKLNSASFKTLRARLVPHHRKREVSTEEGRTFVRRACLRLC